MDPIDNNNTGNSSNQIILSSSDSGQARSESVSAETLESPQSFNSSISVGAQGLVPGVSQITSTATPSSSSFTERGDGGSVVGQDVAVDFNSFASNPPINDLDLFPIDQLLLSQFDTLVDIPADHPLPEACHGLVHRFALKPFASNDQPSQCASVSNHRGIISVYLDIRAGHQTYVISTTFPRVKVGYM